MSAQVVCPHCGKSIKLRDRSLLGKKGKCPGCSQSFLLVEQVAEEEVVSLQLAEEEPLVGTSPQWVPDSAPPAAPPAAGPVYVQVQTPQGIVLAPVISGPLPTYPAAPPAPVPVVDVPPPAPAFPEFNLNVDSPSPTSPTKKSSVRRPTRRSGNAGLWVGLVVATLVIGGGVYWMSRQKAPVAQTPAQTAVPVAVAAGPVEATSPPGAYSRETLTADPRVVAEFKPTQGEPITLNMLPGTNNILIHMRPEKIWGVDRQAKELRASLTEDVVQWLETSIKTATHRTPDQIEEMLIGISVVSKVEPPQVSAVIRLKAAEKMSTLIDEFSRGAEIVSADQKPLVTTKGGCAFHVKDDRTIAICSEKLAPELCEAVETVPDSVTDGIADLLKSSDRERSVSVFVDVPDAITYADQLFEPSVRSAMVRLLEWFGPDAGTASWSLNFAKTFHSEVRVRPKPGRSLDNLRREYTRTFPEVVEKDLMGAVKKMQPSRMGFRQIIGRFPAMVEAFRQATILQNSPTFLTMTTVLPTKAGPNLALGTVLTWDESTRTNFSAEEAMPVATTSDLPKTVMERLKTPIDIEFSRKPLADAFAYIGEETKVNVVVDGDALKMVGYTKNMAQTMSLGKVAGSKGIYAIFTVPMQEKMCLVVDDAKMEALITTIPAAENKGLKIVPVDSLK
jgi:hypothetical protein